jgi:hypothetical protein
VEGVGAESEECVQSRHVYCVEKKRVFEKTCVFEGVKIGCKYLMPMEKMCVLFVMFVEGTRGLLAKGTVQRRAPQMNGTGCGALTCP